MPESFEIKAGDLGRLGTVQVIDIREPDETAREPLLCDHEHVPMNELLNEPARLDKNGTYLLVCAAGVRTKYAANAFRAAGYSKVYSLIGGNRAFENRTP